MTRANDTKTTCLSSDNGRVYENKKRRIEEGEDGEEGEEIEDEKEQEG